MKAVKFTSDAFAEYNEWIENIKGWGKPEPLNENYSGFWSRRIDKEHRLIYSVTKDTIKTIKCKGHYFD